MNDRGRHIPCYVAAFAADRIATAFRCGVITVEVPDMPKSELLDGIEAASQLASAHKGRACLMQAVLPRHPREAIVNLAESLAAFANVVGMEKWPYIPDDIPDKGVVKFSKEIEFAISHADFVADSNKPNLHAIVMTMKATMNAIRLGLDLLEFAASGGVPAPAPAPLAEATAQPMPSVETVT